MTTPTTRGILAAVLLLSIPLGATPARAQHEGELAVYSTTSGGGQFVLDGLPDGLVPLTPSFCAAGLCLWSGTDPGFITPATAPAGLFPLKGSTGVRLEIVSIESGAAVKVGNTVLDAAGESTTLGSAPNLHVHPSWQVTLPSGTEGQRKVTLRVASTNGSYAASASRTLTLSAGTPPTTTTTSTTSTTMPPPFCGDCAVDTGDGEECDAGARNGERGSACGADCTWGACGDPDHSGLTTASDASFLLRAAVRSAPLAPECAVEEAPGSLVPCEPGVCDTDGNGKVTSSDALRALRFAVGQPAVMACPSP